MTIKRFSMDIDGVTYHFTRLGDADYLALHRQSVAIADGYGFYLDLKRSLERRRAALNLAELYATLHSLFGARSTCFDDWKGSFCFPFRLNLVRDEVAAAYLLHIYCLCLPEHPRWLQAVV